MNFYRTVDVQCSCARTWHQKRSRGGGGEVVMVDTMERSEWSDDKYRSNPILGEMRSARLFNNKLWKWTNNVPAYETFLASLRSRINHCTLCNSINHTSNTPTWLLWRHSYCKAAVTMALSECPGPQRNWKIAERWKGNSGWKEKKTENAEKRRRRMSNNDH